MSITDHILNSDLPGIKDAVYHPAGGNPVDCRVIFYNPAAAAGLDAGMVTTTMILAQGSEDIFITAEINDTLVIGTTTYYIIGVMPDNLGMVNLDLSTQQQ